MNAEEKIIKNQERMLRNFVSKYGDHGLKRICNLFVEGTSNQAIAKEFGVTRQRVHQWQKAFTVQKTFLKSFVEHQIN